MAAGRLRHRVTVERLTQTPDALGGYVETWNVLATNVPARVVPLGVGAVEQLSAGEARIEAPGAVLVRLRWHPDWPAVTDRLIFETRVLIIRGLEHVDEDRRWWRVYCVEELS